MRQFAIFVAFIAVPLLIGGAGGFVTAKAIPGWYSELRKPSWNPPNWIFGPVWTLLYLMMGTASWLVWREVGFRENWVAFYGAQLFLNAIWSWVFFGWRRLNFALVNIILLWLAIVACTVVFWRISVIAGAMLIPYLLWVSFASALNYRIWALNK